MSRSSLSLTSLIMDSVVSFGRHLQLHLTNFTGVQPCLLFLSITNIQTQCSLLHGHDIAVLPPQCLKPISKLDSALVGFLNRPCLLHLRDSTTYYKPLGINISYRGESWGWCHRMGQNSNLHVRKSAALRCLTSKMQHPLEETLSLLQV